MTAPQPPKTYGDQQKTAQQISDMAPAEREQYVMENMSPQERYDYFQDEATAKYANEPWLIRLAGQAIASAQAQKQAEAYGRKALAQAGPETEYLTGLSPSNADYRGIDHEELRRYVTTNLDPGQIGEMSNSYHKLGAAFEEFANALNEAIAKSRASWEGEAAEAARGYFTSLQQWADGNAQNARLASEVTFQQSTAAETAKNQMPEPIPFSWSEEVKNWATSNPFDIVDNVQASVEKAQQSQEAHEQAAQVLAAYDSHLYSAASKQPVFAEPPKFEAGGGAGASIVGESIGGTEASGYHGPSGGTGGAGGARLPGGGGTGGSGSVSGALGSIGSPPVLNSGAQTGVSRGNTDTRLQGYQPPRGFPRPTPPTGDALPGMGGMPMGPMGGGVGGVGDEGGRSSGRFGGRGGVPGGSAAGSGSAAEAGPRTGAGVRAGGAGAAEAAGAAGARGAAGRTGMAGMPGMGQRGKGEEDEEHQRPSWLVEADPDDVFGTSERTAPPVIGE